MHSSQDRVLFSINLDLNESSELLTGLWEDVIIHIVASDSWLYVGQLKDTPSGMPAMKLSRYRIFNWDDIGEEEIIVKNTGGNMSHYRIGAICTDGSYFYYWDDFKINRIAEQ